jgi:hypothetical protein
MAMPGRSYQSSNGYRYGMNGQEKDLEIFEGAMTAEYWEYDSRLGRRWNQDPVDYPHLSPYQTFNNCPIALNDPDGLKPRGPLATWWHGLFGGRYGLGHGNSNFKLPNLAKIYGAISGFFRQLGGAHYGGLHIPQGVYEIGMVNISSDSPVQPGTTGPTHNVKQAIKQDIAEKGITSPFPTSVVGIYGKIENGEASIDESGNKIDEGDIEGFAHVEGIVSGSGWHNLFMNTGLRGFMEKRSNNGVLNKGTVDVGSERVPGFNIVDDALGNAIGQIKGIGIANKQTTWFNSTTAIRVVNAKYTKRAVDYNFNVTYKYWRRVQFSNRSKIWQRFHNISN